MNETNLGAKLSIAGVFECRDKDGVLLKTIELKGEIPFPLEPEVTDDDQRSE